MAERASHRPAAAGDRRRRGLLLAPLLLQLAACAAGPRIAPVDEVGVGDGRAATSGPGAPSPAASAPAAGTPAPDLVLSTPRSDFGARAVPLDDRPSGTQGTAPAAGPPQAPAAPSPSHTAPRPTSGLSPAVVALVDDAERRASAGDHDVAAARIERALQVDPGNGWLWHRLASERLAQGRAEEAESLAARSISLAPGNPRLQAAGWRLIEQARRRRGDAKGAREAAEQAARLEAGTA